MTLRPGSFNATRPSFRGIFREDSLGRYMCMHTGHEDARAARRCADEAIGQFKATGVLPAGWADIEEVRALAGSRDLSWVTEEWYHRLQAEMERRTGA